MAGTASAAGGGRTNVACDVVVLGGGAGGLHTAFRLGSKLGAGVCLFEKEDRLGGRIYDVARVPGGPLYGLGALRIMEGQDVVFGLADELGVKYEAAPYHDDLISARGYFASNSDDMKVMAYPFAAGNENALYDKLFTGPERANIDKYPDFRSYVRAAAGEEGYHYLTDVFRFRGDFSYPLSARGYMDFLDEEWNVCCTPSYPVGGMSEFIRRMEQKALQSGVRIYKSQPVRDLSSGPGSGGRYQITTPDYIASANRLVIAVDADGFKRIGGNLAAMIQAQPQFQDLIGVKVASIDQWWPSAWWLGAVPGKDVRRAWTTEHCLNAIEIPVSKYAADQMVTRSVYDDDKACADFWEVTAQRGTAAVEAEIARGLKYLFPGVNIPAPLKTQVQIWPAAWYWLKAGSPFTNAQIASWAILPLAGEAVSLVGESYNPQRAGWSDGAYKSSINTLNAIYGFNLSGATATPSGPLPTFGKGKNVPPGLRKHR
ncbi:MAG TPA: FAD-dependent oxidoreductase [Bryobacteraceae bacterium]|nr:FAD-dependent oxidoreductase [Bryobacteraceae bacterium]